MAAELAVSTRQALLRSTRCDNCGVPGNEEDLFRCTRCPDITRLLCLDCGVPGHRRRDHTFRRGDPHLLHFDPQVPSDEIFRQLEVGREVVRDSETGRRRQRARDMARSAVEGFATGVSTGVAQALANVTLDASLEVMKAASQGAFIASGAVLGVELVYRCYQVAKGDITFKEFGRLACKAVAVNGLALAGNLGGAAVGAAIGTAIFPGVGTVVGGIIGALIGGVAAGYGASQLFEKFWPDARVMSEERMMSEALKFFGFNSRDVDNPQVFNARTLDRRFRAAALEHHPDRPTGSDDKWIEVQMHYGVLKGILDHPHSRRIAKKVLAITL